MMGRRPAQHAAVRRRSAAPSRRTLGNLLLAAAPLVAWWYAGPASAAEGEVRLQPVVVASPAERPPTTDEEALRRVVDAALTAGLEDLDLNVTPVDASAPSAAGPSTAGHHWTVSAVLQPRATQPSLTVSMTSPDGILTATETVELKSGSEELAILKLLPRLHARLTAATSAPAACAAPKGAGEWSEGSSLLAAQSAVLGGLAGYALQKSSGEDDFRVGSLLVALGAGAGLGASVLASQEWDVTVPQAAYLTAGTLWGGLGAAALTAGYESEPTEDRPLWALGGATLGLAVATTASVAFATKPTSGGAAAAHSGGLAGGALGAVTEMVLRRDPRKKPGPARGFGYGSMAVVLAAGALAHDTTWSPNRLLWVDLAMGLGAASGAAIASPLIVNGDSARRTRGWYGVVAGGMLAGGAVGVLSTSDAPVATPAATSFAWQWIPVPHPQADGGWAVAWSGVW